MSDKNDPRSLLSTLLGMAQVYRQSAVLIAACQLDVFSNLAKGPLGASALAERCGVPARGLQHLVNACVVMQLLEKKGATYSNAPIAGALLVKGAPGYMGSFVTRQAENYEAWGRLAKAVREDRPVDLHSADALDSLPAERIRQYIEALYDTGKRSAEAIADKLDLTHARHLLDVAGGSGIYSIVLAQRQPALKATVFDVQPTLAFTKEIISRHGIADRISLRSGNYLHDDFGSGYDLLLLSNVLSTQGPRVGRMLLQKAFNALAPGGQLIVHGSMPNPDGVSPPEAALRQVLLFLMYPEGDAYPAEVICEWAKEAGFIDLDVTRFPPPSHRSLLTGRKAN
jgi:3-hydroxy-5-methyl-1-naphthoate 3-O-methyltransferase